MKILYLTPGVFDKGGISRYNRYQINALRDILGNKNVMVLSLLGPKFNENDLEGNFQVDWHGNDELPLIINIYRFSMMATKIAYTRKPDLIWTGHLHQAGFVYALSRLIKQKSLVQVYGREVWTPRKYRPDIQLGLLKADYVLSDCFFTANYIKENYNFKKEIPVLWDCVDTERFFPKKPSKYILEKYGLPNPDSHFNILTLGRIHKSTEYKGYERLLTILPRLGHNSRLIFAGGGDFVENLKQKAKDMGIAERVFFTGYIHDDDLPDIYRSASIFCLVGDRNRNRGEGIPLTPLEAASCGIPIIVGNQDGSIEAIEQGVNGYSIDPFDTESLLNILKMFEQDGELCQKLGYHARKRIEQFHSFPVFKNNLKNVTINLKNLNNH